MKKILLLFFAGVIFSACNPIPNKSVFEPLTTDELASIIEDYPEFGEAYEGLRTLIKLSAFSEVQKAQYKNVTYRRLFKYRSHVEDFEYWQPLQERWSTEWDNTLGKDLEKIDETVAYWTDYKAKNSLSRFVKIELSRFFITHYRYIGGVEDALICFNITPLDGAIEQLKFSYSYGVKINNGRDKRTNSCSYMWPIAKKTEYGWDIPSWERDEFDGMTAKKFLQKYDLDIEVTDIRKDGKNYSIDDLNIPEPIKKFWEEDSPKTRDAVAVLINPSYVNKDQYLSNKKDEDLRKYDALCFDFLNLNPAENINVFNLLQNILE